jgi:H+/Cl- antiporter ClcA
MPLRRHDGWGLEVFIVIGGGLLGAIAGFVWITFWILRHDSETWSPTTWTGVFLGLFLGLVSGWTLFHLGIPSRLFQQTAHFETVLIPLVSAACATLGGTAGNFVGFLRRDLKDTRHDSKDIF